jgi:hypothetical protein
MQPTIPTPGSPPARTLSRLRLALDPQALLSVAVFLAACLVAVILWHASPPRITSPLAVAALATSIPLAAHVSLKLRTGARLYFTGASILLTVVLLAPALAIVVMGVGMGTKELIVCKRCQNTAWQVLGQTGRWMLIALCASVLAHLTDVLIMSAFVGGVLWLSDVATAPLVLLPRVPLQALYRSLIVGSFEGELLQYLTGALVAPVILLGKQEPLVIVSGVMAVGVWLVLYYLLHSQSDRQAP